MLRSMFSQPAIADPPRRVWRDWVLLGAVYAAAMLETALRTDMVWRVPSFILALAIGPTVLFRRTHPLPALAIAFGAVAAVDVAALIANVEWEGHYSMAFLLTLPYAVFRWGSGRDGALSLLVLLLPTVLGALGQPNPVGNAFGGAVIVLLSALLGAVVRYEFDLMRRRVDDARTEQREEIARDLHDTVAHHVSAIAVQAQAGRAVAANDPLTAVDTLAVIEEEASRTLAEMREMVAALRSDDDQVALTPTAGVTDIEQLVTTTPGSLPVQIDLRGDLDDLRPAVNSALYRLAQESITNARRHAKNASTVEVVVNGETDCLRLTVSDDGDTSGATGPAGHGLIGMAERAKLLGGSFRAGIDRSKGWTVEVVLPREGARA